MLMVINGNMYNDVMQTIRHYYFIVKYGKQDHTI